MVYFQNRKQCNNSIEDPNYHNNEARIIVLPRDTSGSYNTIMTIAIHACSIIVHSSHSETVTFACDYLFCWQISAVKPFSQFIPVTANFFLRLLPSKVSPRNECIMKLWYQHMSLSHYVSIAHNFYAIWANIFFMKVNIYLMKVNTYFKKSNSYFF